MYCCGTTTPGLRASRCTMVTPRASQARNVSFLPGTGTFIAWCRTPLGRLQQVIRGGELQLVQPGVFAAPRQELVVRAQLHDAPLEQHRDPRGVADGGEPVRD